LSESEIKFGLITDIHCDFMYRAIDRLDSFINRANEEKVDFIIQLGDFCHPKLENEEFLRVWEKYKGPRYHVLGNHDMDHESKIKTMEFLGMRRNYYSFDNGDYHFVVLDPNYIKINDQYIDYSYGNYFKYQNIGYVPEEQIQWLKSDLASSKKQTMIFSHQSLENNYIGVKNSDIIHRVLKEVNEEAGFKKVFACMNGHHHLDGVKVIGDIYFAHINSSSYVWLGENYNTTSYTREIRDKFPVLKHSVPYRDSLHAIVTLKPEELIIEGKKSKFVKPTPLEYGHRNIDAGHELVPKISNYRLKI